MSAKIFFDMDGVLVDFAAGGANALQKLLDSGDTSKRQFRRLVDYEGQDRVEPITAEFLELITTIKDTKGERTKWMKRVNDALFGIVGPGGFSYWSALSPLPGYKKMINFAENLVGLENVYICTAPVIDKDGGCEAGKRAWVAKHTQIIPDNVFVTQDKPSILKDFEASKCLLIDDRIKYCDAWKNAGGHAIRHIAPATMTTVQDTISKIQIIVNAID